MTGGKKKKILILLFVIGSLLQYRLVFGEQMTMIYIPPVEFKGFENIDENYSEIIAAEIQNELHKYENIRASTEVNLRDQLKKEKQKELLACDSKSCLQQILENFGISDTIFGRITAITKNITKKIKKKKVTEKVIVGYDIYLTYTQQENVLATQKELIKGDFNVEGCSSHIRRLISQLADEVKFLSPRIGGIEVDSYDNKNNFVKAGVYIDGKYAGDTPYSGEMIVGEHIIDVKAGKYASHHELRIKEKKITPVRAILANNGTLIDSPESHTGSEIHSVPYVDNKLFGGELSVVCSVTTILSIGKSQYSLPKQFTLNTQSGSFKIGDSKTPFRVSIQYRVVGVKLVIDVDSEPWATLVHNGIRVGRTPRDSLSPDALSKHTLVLSNPFDLYAEPMKIEIIYIGKP